MGISSQGDIDSKEGAWRPTQCNKTHGMSLYSSSRGRYRAHTSLWQTRGRGRKRPRESPNDRHRRPVSLPYPRSAPAAGTVGSPQCKDGTSLWRPQSRIMPSWGASGTWQQRRAGDIYGQPTLRIGNYLVSPVCDRSISTAHTCCGTVWVALNARMGPLWRSQCRI